MLKCYRFLSEERVGLLLLYEIDEGVCANSDALDTIEEELFIKMDMRW